MGRSASSRIFATWVIGLGLGACVGACRGSFDDCGGELGCLCQSDADCLGAFRCTGGVCAGDDSETSETEMSETGGETEMSESGGEAEATGDGNLGCGDTEVDLLVLSDQLCGTRASINACPTPDTCEALSCTDLDDLTVGWANEVGELQVEGESFESALELVPAIVDGSSIEVRFYFFLDAGLCNPRLRTRIGCGGPGAPTCAGLVSAGIEPITGPPTGPEWVGDVDFDGEVADIDFDLRAWRGQEMDLVLRFEPASPASVDDRVYFDQPRIVDFQ